MKSLSFDYVYSLIFEKKKNLEGTVEEREEEFLNILKNRPSFYTAYERAIEILKSDTDGLTINDLYADSVSTDDESGKRPIQLSQFKKMIDAASEKVGNINFNIYSGTYSFESPELDELRDGDIPNIEDMDDLDDEDSELSDLENDENIKDAFADYKSSEDLEDY